MLQIGQKTGKWQWHHNFSRWRHRQFFWLYFFSLVRFSYWSNIHVNTITSSGIMKISSYKGLTRNVDIGNTPIWVLPNIWRLEQVMDTKFGANVSNRILLNAAKFQGYSLYRFWVIKRKPTGGDGGRGGWWGNITHPPSHTQIRVNLNYFRSLRKKMS